jgi:hypothetical protein
MADTLNELLAPFYGSASGQLRLEIEQRMTYDEAANKLAVTDGVAITGRQEGSGRWVKVTPVILPNPDREAEQGRGAAQVLREIANVLEALSD